MRRNDHDRMDETLVLRERWGLFEAVGAVT